MTDRVSRREFSRAVGLGLGAAWMASGAVKRRLKIGHTGITWGYGAESAEQAIKDIGALGYYGFESFGHIIEAWEPKGGMGRLLEQAKLPLISAYCPTNLTDASKRADEVGKMVRWGKLIKKYGGTVAVIGPDNVKRDGYNFKAVKPNIVAALNDIGKALAGVGVTGALHQHTGTCVMTRDEVYGVMEAVDTRYVKFGPDVGQLAAGGAEPLKVVKDFLPLIEHVHLKDFDGGPHYAGYCPLGKGKVDIPGTLDLLEQSKIKAMVMVELDPSQGMPIAAMETARMSKELLQKLGYTFRS